MSGVKREQSNGNGVCQCKREQSNGNGMCQCKREQSNGNGVCQCKREQSNGNDVCQCKREQSNGTVFVSVKGISPVVPSPVVPGVKGINSVGTVYDRC